MKTPWMKKRLASVLLFAASALGAWAQGPADGHALSLADCVARGLAASRALMADDSKKAAAKAALTLAREQYIPSLVGSGSYTRSSEVDGGTIDATLPAPINKDVSITLPSPLQDAWLFRLSMQQPLFTGFRVESGIDLAKASLDAAEADSIALRRSCVSSIEKAWWALVLAQETCAVAQDSEASMKAHVSEAQSRLDRGLGLRTELLSAQMRVDDADTLLSDATASLALARARLNILMGVAWDQSLEALAPAAPDDPPEPPPIEGLLERARAARPELASAAARITSAQASEISARSGLLPSVFLTGSFSYANPNPKAFPQSAGFSPLWDLGVLVTMDLGKAPAALAQAEQARDAAEQARQAYAQTGDSVSLDVVSAWLELRKATERLKATASSVGLAEDALRSQKDRLAAGMALPSEVSDAETALLRSRLERTGFRVAWELAKAALRDALGEDFGEKP
jgi:outer membrane protein TolC